MHKEMIPSNISRTRTATWLGMSLAVLLAVIGLAACSGDEAAPEPQLYRASLSTLNVGVHGDTVSGTVTLDVTEDSVTMRIDASGLTPGMHLAHYHGFVDSVEDAFCPGIVADTNADTVIDLLETMEVSGVTMVPFHDDPVSLAIKSESYPVADSSGNLSYEKTVGLRELSEALTQKFGITEPRFADRVVYIHGVSPDAELKASVASLPDVPAHVTLPVACGRFMIVPPKDEVGADEAQDVGASGY